MRRLTFVTTLLSLLTAASSVHAQDAITQTEFVPDDALESTKKQGLDGTLQVSASLNLVNNERVVGQTDGLTTLVGVGLVGNLDWVKGKHELNSSLKVAESMSRTPTIPQFIKSTDTVEIESIYDYYLFKWAGLFARVNFETALFQGDAVTAEPTTYQITDVSGNTSQRTTERLSLSDGFQPLTLRETVGIFTAPVQEDAFKLSIRAGFGLRETWAQGVLVIDDDADTADLVEVKDITNPNSNLTIFQGGFEGIVGATGELLKKRVTYDVGATVLVPFLNNDPQSRTVSQLTRFGVATDIGVAVVDWLSINYKFRLLRDPQMVEHVQLQNSILLSLNYTLIDTTADEAPASELTESEKAAIQRAEEAEQRAAAAEAEAAKLREQLGDAAPEPAPAPAQ